MRAVVSVAQATLLALSASVDSAMGLPKDGVDIGGGIHVPVNMSRTTSYAWVRQNPTLPLFAYYVDAVSEPVAAGLGGVATVLDGTWTLVSAVTGAALDVGGMPA